MTDPIIKKDFYKLDVYRLDFENNHNLVSLDIINSISWDYLRIKATKEELKGLADFIYEFLENSKESC